MTNEYEENDEEYEEISQEIEENTEPEVEEELTNNETEQAFNWLGTEEDMTRYL